MQCLQKYQQLQHIYQTVKSEQEPRVRAGVGHLVTRQRGVGEVDDLHLDLRDGCREIERIIRIIITRVRLTEGLINDQKRRGVQSKTVQVLQDVLYYFQLLDDALDDVTKDPSGPGYRKEVLQ